MQNAGSLPMRDSKSWTFTTNRELGMKKPLAAFALIFEGSWLVSIHGNQIRLRTGIGTHGQDGRSRPQTHRGAEEADRRVDNVYKAKIAEVELRLTPMIQEAGFAGKPEEAEQAARELSKKCSRCGRNSKRKRKR